MIKQLLFLCLSTLFSWTCLGQNLLNTSTWTQGSGSVLGFSQNGSTSENWRILGDNHVGDEVILWEARNDSSSNADGGWNSSSVSIDNTKNYRFTVWIKKTNSTDGRTYFGCKKTNQILNLSGSINNNPYFWSGDLPQLDRWYLLIGYVYNKNYSATGGSNSGVPSGIYDGVTGERVSSANITNFKFASSATSVSHRAYLYYDSNIDDRQYFFDPTIEKSDGTEQSLISLLQVNPNSTITLSYDTAGNQTARFYCSSGTNCRTSLGRAQDIDTIVDIQKSFNDKKEDGENSIETLEHIVSFFPNPTNGLVTMNLEHKIDDFSISIYDTNGKLVIQKSSQEQQLNSTFDLSRNAPGTYLAHIHFGNGKYLTQKIIKL